MKFASTLVVSGLYALFVAATPVPQGGPIIIADPCGGLNYHGHRKCPHGSTCVYLNEYWSQCQPLVTTTPASSTASATA